VLHVCKRTEKKNQTTKNSEKHNNVIISKSKGNKKMELDYKQGKKPQSEMVLLSFQFVLKFSHSFL
jgi:hypothetical protein